MHSFIAHLSPHSPTASASQNHFPQAPLQSQLSAVSSPRLRQHNLQPPPHSLTPPQPDFHQPPSQSHISAAPSPYSPQPTADTPQTQAHECDHGFGWALARAVSYIAETGKEPTTSGFVTIRSSLSLLPSYDSTTGISQPAVDTATLNYNVLMTFHYNEL